MTLLIDLLIGLLVGMLIGLLAGRLIWARRFPARRDDGADRAGVRAAAPAADCFEAPGDAHAPVHQQPPPPPAPAHCQPPCAQACEGVVYFTKKGTYFHRLAVAKGVVYFTKKGSHFHRLATCQNLRFGAPCKLCCEAVFLNKIDGWTTSSCPRITRATSPQTDPGLA